MKDEIKEILELYKNKDIEYYNLVNDLGYDKLLDYITNLQEENNYYFKKNNELSTLNTSLRSDRDKIKYKKQLKK